MLIGSRGDEHKSTDHANIVHNKEIANSRRVLVGFGVQHAIVLLMPGKLV